MKKIKIIIYIMAFAIFSPKLPAEIITLGDIEGSIEIFERFLKDNSKYIKYEKGEWHLKEGVVFIIGGDICDRSPHCFKILRRLLSLKKKYKERIVFLIGNRDLSKIQGYLRQQQGQSFEEIVDTYRSNSGNVMIVESLREELENELMREVSFEEAAAEMFEQIKDDKGLFRQYLLNAQVAYFNKGHRVFALHSAITDANIDSLKLSNTASMEIGANKWFKDKLNLFLAGDAEAGESLDDLIKSSEGTRSYNDKSFIYARNNKHGDLKFSIYSKRTASILKSFGIDYILNYHTPSSGFPVVVKQEKDLYTIIADPTHADEHPAQIVVDEDGISIKKNFPEKGINIDMKIYRISQNGYIGTRLIDGRQVIARDRTSGEYVVYSTYKIHDKFYNKVKKISLSDVQTLTSGGSCKVLHSGL